MKVDTTDANRSKQTRRSFVHVSFRPRGGARARGASAPDRLKVHVDKTSGNALSPQCWTVPGRGPRQLPILTHGGRISGRGSGLFAAARLVPSAPHPSCQQAKPKDLWPNGHLPCSPPRPSSVRNRRLPVGKHEGSLRRRGPSFIGMTGRRKVVSRQEILPPRVKLRGVGERNTGRSRAIDHNEVGTLCAHDAAAAARRRG